VVMSKEWLVMVLKTLSTENTRVNKFNVN
jgi:hypothetical protein